MGLEGHQDGQKQNQSRNTPVICDPSVLGFVSMSWVLSHGGDGVRLMHVFSQFSCFSVFLVFPEHVCVSNASKPIKRIPSFSITSPDFLQECWENAHLQVLLGIYT